MKEEKHDEEKKTTAREELFMLQKRLVEMERKISSIHRWVMIQRIIGYVKLAVFILIIVGAVSVFQKYFPPFYAMITEYQQQIDGVMGVMDQGSIDLGRVQEFLR